MPAADPTKEELKVQKDELKAQLDATRRDVEILAAMVRERATSRVYEARDEVATRLDELSEDARAMVGAAQYEAIRLTNQASDHVRQNPLMSIGIAFGLGWLIGMLNRK